MAKTDRAEVDLGADDPVAEPQSGQAGINARPAWDEGCVGVGELSRPSPRSPRSVLDSLPASIAVLDETGRILTVNAAWRCFGRENGLAWEDGGVGRNYLEVLESASAVSYQGAAAALAGMRQVLAGDLDEFSLEYPCHSADEMRWFTMRVTRFHTPGGIRGVISHEVITDRKLVEEALRRGEERYVLAQRAASIGIWDWNIRTGDLYWSQQIEPIFGFGPGEFGASYEAFLDCIHPDDRQLVIDSVGACVEGGADYAVDHRIVWPDDTVHWVSETGAVFRDERGVALRMLGVVQDISARKQAESALRASEERYRDLVENVSEVIFAVDAQGLFTYVSPLIETFIEYPPTEVVGHPFIEFIAPEDKELIARRYRRLIAGETVGPNEYRIVTRSGDIRWMRVSTKQVVEDGRVVALQGVLADITGRKRAEEALVRRIDELSALHTIAQTVAGTTDLPGVLEAAAETVIGLFDVRVAFIMTLGVESLELQIVAGSERDSGPFPEMPPAPRLDKMPNVRRLLATGRSVTVADVQALPLSPDLLTFFSDLGLHAFLLIPLKARGEVTGLFAVGSDQAGRVFTPGEANLAETIAVDIAATIENARLAEESRAAAVDAERQRLARELHDSVTQSLYSLTLLSNGWGTMAEQGRLEDPAASFHHLGEVGQQALKEMRLLIHQLRPPILDEVGLVGALQQRLDAVEQRSSVDARMITLGALEGVPHSIEEQLFHIAQEALNNVLRHANASEVIVRLRAAEERVELCVEDNGAGFDPSAATAGMGLANIRERAMAIGGDVTITSDPARGTTLVVTVGSKASADCADCAD